MKAFPILLLAASPAMAAPFLYADPYPTTNAPSRVTYTINGGAAIACALETVATGLRPKCDLAQITAAGTYTLVMTAVRDAAITNTPNAADNVAAGSASSAPFAYRLTTAPVTVPVLRVGP